MNRRINISTVFVAFLLIIPHFSFSRTITYQSHYWPGNQYTDFSDYKNSLRYQGSDSDVWLADSIFDSNPFDLYIYNAPDKPAALDIHVIAALHSGESATITFDGTGFFSFPGTGLPTRYGGNPGVWSPSGDEGRFDNGTTIDLKSKRSIHFGEIFFAGLSEVHIDSKAAEPSTLLILGTGLIGIAILGKKVISIGKTKQIRSRKPLFLKNSDSFFKSP